MKPIYIFLLVLLTGHSFAQEIRPFVFVPTTIARLEKYASQSDDYIVSTPELKKRMQGMFLLEKPEDTVKYNKSPYLKFSAIPKGDKFIMITNAEYGNESPSKNLIIQNLVSKKYYCIMAYAIKVYQDHTNMGNAANGNGWLVKFLPKELSPEKKQLLTKYKELIKSANVNMLALANIQGKYKTRGYFDSSKVPSAERTVYNKNLNSLKEKASKLSDIDRYEDKNDEVQDKLTQEELVKLMKISDWMGYQNI